MPSPILMKKLHNSYIQPKGKNKQNKKSSNTLMMLVRFIWAALAGLSPAARKRRTAIRKEYLCNLRLKKKFSRNSRPWIFVCYAGCRLRWKVGDRYAGSYSSCSFIGIFPCGLQVSNGCTSCDEVALSSAFRYGSSTWIAHGKITSGLHWHLS